MSTNMAQSTPSLEGNIQINRRKYWVIRYVILLEEGILQYTKKKNDGVVRGSYNLKLCHISEYKDNQKQKIIMINTIEPKPVSLKLMLDSTKKHQIWLNSILTAQANAQNKGLMKSHLIAASEISCGSAESPEKMMNSLNGLTNQVSNSIVQSLTENKQSTLLQQYQQNREPSKTIPSLSNGQQNLGLETTPAYPLPTFNADNDNNPYILDDKFFTQLSEKESHDVKAKVNKMLSEYNKKEFVLSDSQSDLQLYSQKIAFTSDTFKQKSGVLASGIIQKNDDLKEKLGLPLYTVAIIVLTLAFIWVIHAMGSLFSLIPISFSVVIALNIVLVPLFSDHFGGLAHKLKQQSVEQETYKILAEGYYSHNVNELLFALTRHEQRSSWQPYLLEAKVEKENMLSLKFMGDEESESIKQIIYKENNNSEILCVEINTKKQEIARLIKIILNPFDSENTHIIYMSRASYHRFNQIEGKNSPAILTGLDFFIKTEKINPTSAMCQYYIKAAEQNYICSSQQFNLTNVVGGSKKQQTTLKTVRQVSTEFEEQIEQIQPTQNRSDEKRVQEAPASEEQETQEETVILEKKEEQQIENIQEKEEKKEEKEEMKFVSEEHKIVYEKLLAKSKEYERLTTLDSSWKKIEEKGTLKVHSKVDPETGLTISRGETIINTDMQTLNDFVANLDNKKQYDEMFREGKIIQEFSDKISIAYNRMKGKMGVEDRDFCFAQGQFKQNDDKIIAVATSHDHPDCPPVKGATRGKLVIGGWCYIKIDDNTTKAIYSSMADPNGSLPEFIKAWAAKLQGFSVDKVKKLIEKKK